MATKKSDSAKTKSGTAKKAAGKTPATGGKEKSTGELVSALAETTGLSKAKAKEVLDAHAELLISELKENGSVQLVGIGKLKLGNAATDRGATRLRAKRLRSRQAKP